MIICDKMIAFVDEARAWLYMSKTSTDAVRKGSKLDWRRAALRFCSAYRKVTRS